MQQILHEMHEELAPARGLSRPQLLDGILELNPTAMPGFLMKFSDRALKRYLDHLLLSAGPRGPGTRWVRETAAPGIVQRENLD